MNSEPHFSIIIPSYNRAELIGKTIDSVLAQSYNSWELIVIDDGSTDHTVELVSAYEDPRINLKSVKNGERGRARNIGVSFASGCYVYFLDSDDLLYPQHLQVAADMLANKPSDILWLPYEQVDAQGKPTRAYKPSSKPVFDRLIEEGNFISCHGIFLKREIADKHPFEEERALAGSEDMELWIRLAARYRFELGNQVTSCLVEHDARSVMNFNNIDALITRKERMISYLEKDVQVQTKLAGRMDWIRANAYSYISLHCMVNQNTPNRVGWQYFLKSIKTCPSCAWSRRSLAIIKHGWS